MYLTKLGNRIIRMNKIIILSCSLLCACIQLEAQNYFEIYQNGSIVNSIAVEDVNSIYTDVNSQNKQSVYFDCDNVTIDYETQKIDSIKIYNPSKDPLVYLGLVGFNQDIYPKPIDILSKDTEPIFTSFINQLESADGSILYYAIDQALNELTTKSIETSINNVTLLSFTDGLDQGSLMLNSKYDSESDYLNYLHKRINNTVFKDKKLTAFSIGLRGNDVSDYNLFKDNLNKLASSPDYAFEAKSMDGVRDHLRSIAEQLISINNQQTISVRIPGPSNGTIVRFTFYDSDNSSNYPNDNSIYIEGVFNLSDRSLRNVKYHGLSSSGDTEIKGKQEGIFVTFTFPELQRTDGKGLINTKWVHQYNKSNSSTQWQENSEFNSNNNVQTSINHFGGVIIVVLDCSKSLGSYFSDMKRYVKDFISNVANNAAPFSIYPPQELNAYVNSDNAVELSWNKVKYADCYDVYRSFDSKSGIVVANDVKENYWIDNSAQNNLSYDYQVVAKGHGLTSEKSNSCHFGPDLSKIVNLEPNVLIFNSEGGSHDVSMTNSIYRLSHVTISSDGADWCFAKVVNDKVTVTVKPYNGQGNRQCTITCILTDTKTPTDEIAISAMIVQNGFKDNDGGAWVDPVYFNFPREGGVNNINYGFGLFGNLNRVFAADWLRGGWSSDYQGTNRFKQQFFLAIPPNTTGVPRNSTILFYFGEEKGTPYKNCYCIPIIVRQEGGNFTNNDLKSLIVGKWHHHIISSSAWQVESNYDLTINADGTYTEVQKEDNIIPLSQSRAPTPLPATAFQNRAASASR